MIQKIITKEITTVKDNTGTLKKIAGAFLVASTLYDGLNTMEIEITDPTIITSFDSADKAGRRAILEKAINDNYTEWVKGYAVDRTETYTDEDGIKKVIGNPVISK